MEDNPAQNPNIESVSSTTPPEVRPKHLVPAWLKILAPVAVIVLAVILSVGAYLSLSSNKQVACTMEAKLCPDGSSVGRTGPKCEFSKCPIATPTPNPTANWKTYTSTSGEYLIRYPSDFTLHINEAHVFETNTYKPTPDHLELNSDKVSMIPYITISSFPNTGNFQDFINKEIGSDQSLSHKTTAIDVYENIPSAAGTLTEAFSQHDNKFYVITIENTADKAFPDMFLSTFKFTDSSKETISPTPTPNPITNNWNKYSDSKYDFSFKFPTDWTTQVKDFPENNQRLINIIKNSSPDVVSLSFTISDNWNNTGNAQYLPKNITVGGVQALRVDPPKPEEKQLERYQANIYLEQGGHVYFFACTHNWNQDYINTCNNILSTVRFKQ